jgi:type I restriction enzyme S subunit
MIAGLKPYADCRDSGLPWLGQLPSHWEIRRIKTILQEVDRRSSTGMEPLLSLRMQAGLVDHHALGGRPIPSSALIGYKRVLPGEIVMNRMRATAGLFAAATSDGLVSPDYAIFRPVHQLNVAYAVQLFRTPAMAAVFRLESTGLGTGESGFLRLYSDQFGRLAIPIPPTAEQAAIVRFLGWANDRLERTIRAKRKVIALLTEQKQAIIHRAVTRGLDPGVPLKPSGLPWLGDIPQHWEVISLRMRYSVELGKMLDAKRITGRHSIPYLRNRDVQWDQVLVDDLPHMDIAPEEFSRYTVQKGDLLICEGGQVGRSAFWEGMLPVCGYQKALHRVRSFDRNRDYPRFLFYQLQLAAGLGVFSADGNENTIAHLTNEKLRRHRFAFPPLAEQRAVADALDTELLEFRRITGRLEREIDLLREYRTRLIADVVTGQLDVREAAARLPAAAALDAADEFADDPDDTELADEETAA